jgi:septum formation protein
MLILASRSPRRNELLRAAGFTFDIRVADVDESIQGEELPIDYVQRVARKKALAVAQSADDIILGADTTVALGTEILGKPRDNEEAREMLQKLSGKRHDVYTGMCLRSARGIRTDAARTGVWFAEMSEAEIDAYVQSGEPLDKAGAYAIQGLASKFIPRIEGSYSNVVGLPVDLLYRMLKQASAADPALKLKR